MDHALLTSTILLRLRQSLPTLDLSNQDIDAKLVESAEHIATDIGTLLETSQKAGSDASTICNPIEPDAVEEEDTDGWTNITSVPAAIKSPLQGSLQLKKNKNDQWCRMLFDDVPLKSFESYCNVLFDFIVETWSTDATIGYSQLREFALYSGLDSVPPSKFWVEEHRAVLWGYAFSTIPLQKLYEDMGVPHTIRKVRRKQLIFRPGPWQWSFWREVGTWKCKYAEWVKYYDDSPVLDQAGWMAWHQIRLLRNPSIWYQEQQRILDNIPRKFRMRLPDGPMPREILPTSAILPASATSLVSRSTTKFSLDRFPWPFPRKTQEDNRHFEIGKAQWDFICKNRHVYGVLMYRQLDQSDIIDPSSKELVEKKDTQFRKYGSVPSSKEDLEEKRARLREHGLE